jgi:hypothetical protein
VFDVNVEHPPLVANVLLCNQQGLEVSLRGFKFTFEFYMAQGCNSHTKYHYCGSDLYADEDLPHAFTYTVKCSSGGCMLCSLRAT